MFIPLPSTFTTCHFYSTNTFHASFCGQYPFSAMILFFVSIMLCNLLFVKEKEKKKKSENTCLYLIKKKKKKHIYIVTME